jgi:hypothetical protein
MVSRLLYQGGLYLGPDSEMMPAGPDNPDGFWENRRFLQINDGILEEIGIGWDWVPSAPMNFHGRDGLSRLRGDAETLVQDFLSREPWGWKDPRNCLTLPFWTGFFPDLKVVLCVRNPIEVALSLQRRNFFSFNHSLALWAAYNRRALEAVRPENCLITHYDAYFCDPRKEAQRLFEFLHLPITEEALVEACGAISDRLRHHRFTAEDLRKADLAPDLLRLYAQLCVHAGWPDFATAPKELADLPASPVAACQRTEGAASEPPQTQRLIARAVVESDVLRREVQGLRCQLAAEKAGKVQLQARFGEQARQLDAQARQLDVQVRQLQAALQALAVLEKAMAYQALVRQIREAVNIRVPRDATVIVVSKGDEELLQLNRRRAWHYPQTESGEYSGYHPADSGAAIAGLDALRARGADYFLLPEPAFWWLDFYADFRKHLESHFPVVFHRDDLCRIYALQDHLPEGQPDMAGHAAYPPWHAPARGHTAGGAVPPANPSQPSHALGALGLEALKLRGQVTELRSRLEMQEQQVKMQEQQAKRAAREAEQRARAVDHQAAVICQLQALLGATHSSLPQASALPRPTSPAQPPSDGERRQRVLVLGIYLAGQPNNVAALVDAFASSERYQVTQSWAALGGTPPTEGVAQVTTHAVPGLKPKCLLLNDLLAAQDLDRFAYVVVSDDDIALPERFLDRYLALQTRLSFAIAQPARTPESFIDHHIVVQQRGAAARQTLFVESGPLVSFQRPAFHLALPYDLSSPMGWGVENVWAYRVQQHGLKMGIIDALPVEHRMRARGAYYDCLKTRAERLAYLAKTPHLPNGECYLVLDVIPLPETEPWPPQLSPRA